MGLIEPKDALEVVTLELNPGRPSDYGRELLRAARDQFPGGVTPAARWLMSLKMAGKSDYLENKVIDHFDGKASTTLVTPVYLALCTVVPEDSKTGTTITEASYTGYARKSIAASALGSAASGEGKNSEALTFAECTAGSSTVIGWALCDASTVGNMLWWGTVTSTVISTTQTPASVAVSGLVLKED